MAQHARKADGRRVYSPQFKREQLARVERGELTLAELSRELEISRSLLQRWKHLAHEAADTAVGANDRVVPAGELRAAQARIQELERALGRQTMAVEILQAARDEVKKKPRWYGGSSR